MNRKLMALLVLATLACAAALAARRPAEVAVMAMAVYSSLGIVVSAEHADLGYERSQWPLIPWLQKGAPGVMTAVFLGMLGIALAMVWHEIQAQAPAKQKRRKRNDQPRQRTTHRMRPRTAADRDEEDERASTAD
jgi:asparagine N-glycosylation enzyme membrane subunit Stt3